MTQEIEEKPPTEEVATEINDEVRAAYDRIANPDKVQEEIEEEVVVPTVETPPEPTITPDEIKDLKAQVARIPELEKRLRDDGGRYGGLKQTIDDLQKSVSGRKVVNEKRLEEFKDAFPELAEYIVDLLPTEKEASSQDDIAKKISEGLQEHIKKFEQEQELKEIAKAQKRILKRHPEFFQMRESAEFKSWYADLPNKQATEFAESDDPDYIADRFDEFVAWKEKKSATPETKAEAKQVQNKRLMNAVLPTNGIKQNATGDNKQAQVRAAYDRVAGNRR